MSKFLQKLDTSQKSEIKNLYSGSSGCINQLSKLFKVHRTTIEWIVDHNDRKRKAREYSRTWKRKNPEKTKEMNRKAVLKYLRSEKGKKTRQKYYLKNRKKIAQRYYLYYHSKKGKRTYRKYYLKNREKIKQRHRKYYLKNREKILKRLKKKYQLKKLKI